MPHALETPRLTARLPRRDDIPAMLALYGLPEVAARLHPDRAPPTAAEVGLQLETDVAHWRAVLLIDSRRGPLPQDVEVMTLLDRSAVSYQLVLTKVDKLKAGELVQVEQQTLEESRRHAAAHPELIATSAEKGGGIAALRAALAALATPLSREGEL